MTELANQATNPPARKREYPLERPWNRRKLIHELARGEKTQYVLADEYGTTQSAISQFQTRHVVAIDEVRRDMENMFAGLWIADKGARLAIYQDDAETLADATDNDSLKVKHAILKAVAEELGQLPSKVSIAVGARIITYRIEGVDLDALR